MLFNRYRSKLAGEIPDLLPLFTVDQQPADETDGGGADPSTSGGSNDTGTDDLAGLRKALSSEREQRRAEAAELRRLRRELAEVGDKNPKLLEEAKQRVQEAHDRADAAEQLANARVREAETKHEAILAKRTADLEAKTRVAERAALKVKTERIYLANEGRSEASSIDGSTPFDYLWQVFGGQFAEDERGIHLIDATGNPQIDTETGRRITPADLFQKLRDDPVHGVSFKPRFGSGSGVRAGRDGRVTTAEQLDGLKTSQLLQIGLRNAKKTA